MEVSTPNHFWNSIRAFNFGIPSFPWVNGRDLAGTVVEVSDEPESESRIHIGDSVLVPSTDYRDIRKAAFQEYAIATRYNAARIPPNESVHDAASLGVAFVASVLALGVSLGLDYSQIEKIPGPNFVDILEHIGQNDSTIPVDIRGECFKTREERERLKKGDWVAIWGGTLPFIYISPLKKKKKKKGKDEAN